MADSLSIEARFTRVHAAIITASEQAGRAHNEVTLLAVSKKQSVVSIRELYAAGQVDFGENYVQEAVTKIEALRDLDIRWHYIGQIQRNKTRTIAEHFAWVQSVDRLLIAKRLSDERPDSLPPLNLCLQVNMQGEAQKAGVAPEDTLALVRAVAVLPRLCLRGIMVIPKMGLSVEASHRVFSDARQLLETMQQDGLNLDTLSMGMSADYPIAIAEGATMVRVGTDLFGARSRDD